MLFGVVVTRKCTGVKMHLTEHLKPVYFIVRKLSLS